LLLRAETQLGEYFRGSRKRFDLPLDLRGTAFQRKVWAELGKIPFGATWSYRELAERIGNPGAVRAVGTANGRNPVCILIPCHRVVRVSGDLGGYAGGLENKAFLLELEKESETVTGKGPQKKASV
jgi:methylated-DNA-[protein]-cysteine S-methyltransferase